MVMSWLKGQQEKRWEDRLSVRKNPEEDETILFTLKTHFNDAWKYVNVKELERIIKAEWTHQGNSILGKRSAEGNLGGSSKRRKLMRNAIASTPGGSEGTPAQKKIAVKAEPWIEKGRFIVSRKKNTQLWDLTRTWNKLIFNNHLETFGYIRPSHPLYEQVINDDGME
jgi:hypothetical protein